MTDQHSNQQTGSRKTDAKTTPARARAQPAVPALERLVRGEIAAAETYHQILDGIESSPDGAAASLRAIQRDHGDAIRYLAGRLSECGVEPPTTSGAWGLFARALEGAARIIGNAQAMAVLRKGEEQGLHDYEAAIEAGKLDAASEQHVIDELIPRQRRHIDELNRLIGAA